jgi:hypothetical protein
VFAATVILAVTAHNLATSEVVNIARLYSRLWSPEGRPPGIVGTWESFPTSHTSHTSQGSYSPYSYTSPHSLLVEEATGSDH